MAVRKGRRAGDEKARGYLLLLQGGGREAFIESGRENQTECSSCCCSRTLYLFVSVLVAPVITLRLPGSGNIRDFLRLGTIARHYSHS